MEGQEKTITYAEHMERISVWIEENAKLREEMEFYKAIVKKIVLS